MKIAVDAMGGDFAPEQVVAGAIAAAKHLDCEVVLVGDQDKVQAELAKDPSWENLKISIHHTSDVIGMDEHPGAAVRRGPRGPSGVIATGRPTASASISARIPAAPPREELP